MLLRRQTPTSLALLPLALALVAAGCKNEASLAFRAAFAASLSADSLGVPDSLRSGDTLQTPPCDGACTDVAPFSFTCNGGQCDPAPIDVAVSLGDAVDLNTLAGDLKSSLDRATSIEFSEGTYDARANTLTFATPPISVFWGPESATSVSDPGVHAFGTLPPIAAGATGRGNLALDGAGQDALSSYLVSNPSARRIRFFGRAPIDLAPGQAFPAGNLDVGLSVIVTFAAPIVK